MQTEIVCGDPVCGDCGDIRVDGVCPDCGTPLCRECLDIDARCLPCLKKHDAALCAASPERE